MKLDNFITKKPFIISGPCSAESEEQVVNTASQLIDFIDVFRAGVWKPRTQPGGFEGVGGEAIKWIIKVKEKLNIPVCTEVANAKHVEQCLNAGVDMLWIGARTTVNPFYVQEIATALKGINIPVFVKNPIHPELSLWIGALERLNRSGVSKLLAIHRGFFTYESSAYRNEPKWEIPIELKKNLPELSIICDPSHIAGDKKLIYDVAQTAMDLDMNGLMLETHVNPKKALSDTEQQLTPMELKEILDTLVYRKTNLNQKNIIKEISKLREIIDQLDKQIVKLLNERNTQVSEIAKFKLQNEITIFQIERWVEILETRKQQAFNMGLDPKMISDIFSLIHKYSILTQTKIMRKI